MSWERKSRQPCAGTFIRVILSCPSTTGAGCHLGALSRPARCFDYRPGGDAGPLWLSPPAGTQYTARALGFPLSRVYGVATFYNLFQLSPPGRYLVRICKGTACHVNRSADILARVQAQLGIGEDATTPDGLLTLQTVACLGHAAWRR